MTSSVMPRSKIGHLIEVLSTIFSTATQTSDPATDPQADLRHERDFVLDMLDRSPEAFQSDFDVMSMALMHRCKY